MAMAIGKARRRGRLSILDMSVEDDSLLPCPAREAQHQEMRPQRESGDEIPGDKVDEEAPAMAMAAPLPPPARKAKKKQPNLRKSLAWDKAFLTGEGVLDADELPIPTRSSPKKLPELPTLQVKTSLHDDCSAAAADREANRESLRVRSFSERFADCRFKPLDVSILQSVEDSPRDRDIPSPVVPRCAPAKKAIESAIEKGTRLRLPSTFIAEEKQNIPRPPKPPKGSNLAKRVTGVSRKVKDTLGRVLPGRVERSAAVRTTGDVPSAVSQGETSCSLESCSASSVRDSIICDSGAEEEGCDSRDSQSHPTKANASSSDDLRPKPTGLRVPSPKLGFFDPGRPPTQHRYATRSAARIPTGTAPLPCSKPQPKPRPHGLPRGRPLDAGTERVSSSGIPSAPHLRKVVCGGGGQENSNSKRSDIADENSGSSSATTNAAAAAAAKCPLAVNAGLLNSAPSVAREKSSFFAMARKAVGRLSSPVQEKHPSQEKTASGLDDDAAPAAPEPSPPIGVEADAKLVKTGPVQHSPPNKPTPQPGPWSPVRKNSTQPGPFDCTKSNAQIAWECE